jgi:hypothetical protein
MPDGRKNICKFDGGLEITSGHPILHEGKWQLPREVKEPESVECSEVFNIVVNRHHIIFVNSIPLILPGHSYQDPVIEHEYLGSS